MRLSRVGNRCVGQAAYRDLRQLQLRPSVLLCAKIAAFTQFEVRNYSVGACPNVSLLFSLTQAADQRIDYIIVEPAVTDAEWLRLGLYDRATLDRNFREFVKQARALWQARIILLVLPTKQELKDPTFSPRAYYRNIAEELDLSFIDFYSVYEQFFAADRNVEWMFFEDDLHLSPSLFSMLADILWSLILGHEASRRGRPRPASGGKRPPAPSSIRSRGAHTAGREIVRSTSLISQTFLRMEANDTVVFEAERESLLTSLVVNRSSRPRQSPRSPRIVVPCCTRTCGCARTRAASSRCTSFRC